MYDTTIQVRRDGRSDAWVQPSDHHGRRLADALSMLITHHLYRAATRLGVLLSILSMQAVIPCSQHARSSSSLLSRCCLGSQHWNIPCIDSGVFLPPPSQPNKPLLSSGMLRPSAASHIAQAIPSSRRSEPTERTQLPRAPPPRQARTNPSPTQDQAQRVKLQPRPSNGHPALLSTDNSAIPRPIKPVSNHTTTDGRIVEHEGWWGRCLEYLWLPPTRDATSALNSPQTINIGRARQ